MARQTVSTSPLVPYKSDGTRPSEAPGADASVVGRGVFTLASGTTYYYDLGGADCDILSVHMQHDAAIAITSATIEDTNLPEADAAITASLAGLWIDEDPSTAFVGVVGANTTATNGVVAVTAGALGGAMWHMANTGARRHRLKVVVGGTGGELRVTPWGKG